MFGVRSLVRNNGQIIRNVIQQRNMSALAVPARNKVTKGEKFLLASVMVVGWCTIPAWVLVNLKHYRSNE